MDFDLLSQILTEDHRTPTVNVLQNLPDRTATQNGQNTCGNKLQDQATPTLDSDLASSCENCIQAITVISKIEGIFESITDGILQQKEEVVIRLFPRRKPENRNTPAARFGSTKEQVEVRFPSKSPQEVWKFTVLLRILELVHEALVTGAVTTKREIYYRDPELFMKQEVVDRYLNDLSYSLGVERDALNVVAAAKGLVAGSFAVVRKDNQTKDYSSEKEGYLIPHRKDISSFQFSGVFWILVIEKEATFRGLSNAKYWNTSLAGKGIMVTAKGYPDIQTRQFLHLLSTCHRDIPIFCLVDFDPDGIGIMSTYKYGSVKLHHENHNLIVPSINWLGVKSADIVSIENSTTAGLLRLSCRDRRISCRMLERPEFQEVESEWRRELQVMLVLNCKAEIQILSDGGADLRNWLDRKLTSALVSG